MQRKKANSQSNEKIKADVCGENSTAERDRCYTYMVRCSDVRKKLQNFMNLLQVHIAAIRKKAQILRIVQKQKKTQIQNKTWAVFGSPLIQNRRMR